MTAIRDKVGWAVATAVSLLLIATLAGVVRGGPLDPPGPVAPTGKTVITSLPFTISQPGSYVLNGNLTGVSGQPGITVITSNVTIDLQGFELVGIPGAGAGINSAPYSNLTVRNGTVRNWPSDGIYGGDSAVVADVHVVANGLGVTLGARSSVTNCVVEGTTSGYGISVGDGSAVSDCRSYGNSGRGLTAGAHVTITDTVAVGNADTEILVDSRAVLENCVADGNGTVGYGIAVGDNSIIRGCTARNNGDTEIVVSEASTVSDCVADGVGTPGHGILLLHDSVLTNCTARNNGGIEIVAGHRVTLENCIANGWNGVASGPGNGIQVGAEAVVRGCSSSLNAGDGIIGLEFSSTIEGCVSDRNGGDGIEVASSSVVRGCTSTGNVGSGIYITGDYNRIEGNNVTDGGIIVAATGDENVAMMNTADSYFGVGTNQFPNSNITSSEGPWYNWRQP